MVFPYWFAFYIEENKQECESNYIEIAIRITRLYNKISLELNPILRALDTLEPQFDFSCNNCTCVQIIHGLIVCGEVPAIEKGSAWHSAITTPHKCISPLVCCKQTQIPLEVPKTGGIQFGVFCIPIDVLFHIVEYYGEGISRVSKLCLLNRDVSRALGQSATAMLTRSKRVHWDVCEQASNKTNPYGDLISKNKSLTHLTIESPSRVIVSTLAKLERCTQLQVLRLKTLDSYISLKKLVNLHTLCIDCLSVENVFETLASLKKLRHLEIRIQDSPTEFDVRITNELKSLCLETDCTISHFPRTLKKLDLRVWGSSWMDLDLPQIKWLQVDTDRIYDARMQDFVKFVSRMKGLDYFLSSGSFASCVALENTSWLPRTVTFLSVNFCVKFFDRVFEYLGCKMQVDYKLTCVPKVLRIKFDYAPWLQEHDQKHGDAPLSLLVLLEQLKDWRIEIECNVFFSLVKEVRRIGCKQVTFNGFAIRSSKIVL